ncbi:hypothetical protein PM082_021164 [Marasmius tenuissimus]|nr:hypothetical protein PM082_021164 [Marasmius tenuissimus]
MVIPMNTLNHEDDLLIAQLHLQDAEELATRCERKGKGREGAPPTDSVYAFELQANFMKEYITEMRTQREADAFGRHGGRHPVARPTSANARAGSSRETQLYGGAHEENSAPPQRSRHSDRYSGEPWPAYSSSSYGRGSTDTMSNTLRMALSTLPDDLNAGYQPSYNENRERYLPTGKDICRPAINAMNISHSTPPPTMAAAVDTLTVSTASPTWSVKHATTPDISFVVAARRCHVHRSFVY